MAQDDDVQLAVPSTCTLPVEAVIVSISRVPKIPRPVSNFQVNASTPPPAGPEKSPAQTARHGGPDGAGPPVVTA